MTKHTPGPWVAREQRSTTDRSLGWIVEHSNGRIGWSCYATSHPNEGEDPPYPIGAANAHLIAAAPDMLAALKMVRETTYQMHDETLRTIEAAIAKAEP